MHKVIRLARDARDARYDLLRGYFHGADDDTVEERQQARLASVTLPPAAACLGRTLADLALHAIGVSVVSVRHASGAVTKPSDTMTLHAGDTLVVSGLPEPLARAEEVLLRGAR
jgi:CPA2 family monovalent cation:H+ antiporter-2